MKTTSPSTTVRKRGAGPSANGRVRRARPVSARHEDKLVEILSVSARLFAEHGYGSTSLDLIADTVGMHKATLYHYVEGKESILYQCLLRSFVDLDEVIAGMEDRSRPVLERLRYFAQHLARAQNNEFGRCLMLIGPNPLTSQPGGDVRKFQRKLDNAVRALLDEGMADGTVRQCNPVLASAMLFGSLNWVPQWHPERGKFSIEEIVDQYLDIFIMGVRAQPTEAAAR